MRLRTLSFVFALWLGTLSFVKGQGHRENKNLDISNLKDTDIGTTVRLPCAIGFVGFIRLKCVKDGWRKESGRICERKPMLLPSLV
uniref:Sushi domain-containing protein n=1 Tax=Hucho hucho TaxID=62062 RepID=A0A4W5Q0B1_9TELE